MGANSGGIAVQRAATCQHVDDHALQSSYLSIPPTFVDMRAAMLAWAAEGAVTVGDGALFRCYAKWTCGALVRGGN